jgi:hypothetical protein
MSRQFYAGLLPALPASCRLSCGVCLGEIGSPHSVHPWRPRVTRPAVSSHALRERNGHDADISSAGDWSDRYYSDVPTTTNIEGWGHMSSQALRYRSSSSNREYLGRDVYKSLHVNDLGADYA